MTFTDAEIDALHDGAPRIGLFLRLEVDPVLRCWLGVGSIDVGFDVLDAGGATYRGFGQMLNLPVFQQLINGAAERVELKLSGGDDGILALANFSGEVKGKRCDIGFALFDEAWALLGSIHWCRHYVADFLAMEVSPASDPDQQTTKTATLSIGSLMTGRRRRGLSYFNNQDQQARSPTDLFCERVAKYSVLAQKLWPKF